MKASELMQKYVHELQYILWALGVDDNIEL